MLTEFTVKELPNELKFLQVIKLGKDKLVNDGLASIPISLEVNIGKETEVKRLFSLIESE